MNPVNTENPLPEPNIDYLARDFTSFRQLILDQMSVLTPTWTETSAADVGQVLVDLLAYTADYLSYYQDAAATEAYLGTARLRRSVRRHARLLDYFLHEGCNARVWVHLEAAAPARVPVGALLLTRRARSSTVVLVAREFDAAAREGSLVFETLHDLDLVVAHNAIDFHVADPRRDYLLPAGATTAQLEMPYVAAAGGAPTLKAGDVLIFEELLDPVTGSPLRANLRHRHAVRLTRAFAVGAAEHARAGGAQPPGAVVQIEWAEGDALPFPLYIGRYGRHAVTVARGNIVLADHGREIAHEDLPPVPARARYRPSLRQPDLTYHVPYHHASALAAPASDAVTLDPRRALPQIQLFQTDPAATLVEKSNALLCATEDMAGRKTLEAPASPKAPVVRRWHLQQDLLNSEPAAPDYVVEMEDDGRAFLRFGFGNLGQPPAPGMRFFARYRVGNGSAGNIGPDTLAHLHVPDEVGSDEAIRLGAVTAVRNLLPARSGIDAETLDEARLYAPEAFRHQERCVTKDDYVERTGHYPGVDQARAVIRQVGAWRTVFIYVRRSDFAPLAPAFRDRLRAYLEPYRYTGTEIEIAEPYYVPLRVALRVYLKAGAPPTVTREKLAWLFGEGVLDDGSPAFFAPANFQFGASVYQSKAIAAAMAVPGVAWAEATEFCRADAPGVVLEEIPLGPLEIAELRSRPGRAHGVLIFDIREAT
jgi:hypothetical protein